MAGEQRSEDATYPPPGGANEPAPRLAPIMVGDSATAPELASDLYRLLVGSVKDYAIFALDPKGYVASWNEGAQRIKGYKPSEIIGKHFSTFYTAEDINRGKPPWELEVAAEVGRFEDEGWRVRKDGSLFWANVVITALFSPEHLLLGYAKVTRDLTERREAQLRAIADARRVAEAEAANVAKSEFLAAMSHELRTPLNAIGGYTELLAMGLRGPITVEQQMDLERIRHSQRHLLGIVNDLLNFSRIEAGQLTYEISDVPVEEAITSVRPMIEPQASLKGITFTLGQCEAGATIRADRPKVEQILLNLLSNAVKFTSRGGEITVACSTAAESVHITVTDTGVGIPKDKLSAIFEPFVQVGRSLTHSSEGTGLGLAISRDLARAMGGDLTVESELGAGSTFILAMPRA